MEYKCLLKFLYFKFLRKVSSLHSFSFTFLFFLLFFSSLWAQIDSNLTINTPTGKVHKGDTIYYGGYQSGINNVEEAKLYAGTSTDTNYAVKVENGDVTPPTPEGNTYTGWFKLTQDVSQWKYIWVRIKVKYLEYYDWSNSLEVPHITGINITSPSNNAKCRGTVRITWETQGEKNGWEEYEIEYYDGTWKLIKDGITDTFYDWDTTNNNTNKLNLSTTIRVTEKTSGVSATINNVIIDNTPPNNISFVGISGGKEGIIPDVSKGNNGRYMIGIKKSDWYINPPTINLKIEDPPASDGSCAGIKGVAYRFNIGGNKPQDWIIQTYSVGQSSVDLSIPVNVEGEDIYLEVVAADDAQVTVSSVSKPDEAPYLGKGNYSSTQIIDPKTKIEKPLNVDLTPPKIKRIRVDKLPDGPNIDGILWYKSAPVVYIPLNDIEENVSRVLEEVIAFTVDGTDIDDFNNFSNYLTDDTGLYPIDLIPNLIDKDSNGKVERVVFKSYLESIGINPPDNSNLNLYFPVFNSYGKKIKVRIWDNAGNISEQFVDNPWYIERDNQDHIIREEQISLYVDTVPPDTKVTLTGNFLPTKYKDIGTYENNYTDTWRHNKEFPRPEDCPPPGNYPNDYIDYIYFASTNNRFLQPLSLTISSIDSLYGIYEGSIYNKRPLTILPGHPDYDPRYDILFSDFTQDNPGSGVLSDLTGIQYRFSFNNNDILTDLRSITTINNKFYAVGEKGVILESDDGINWNIMTFENSSTLNCIYGNAQDNIWVCGENGIIAKFDGNNWVKIDISTSGLDPKNPPTFYSIYIDGGNVYFAGTGGVILKYKDGKWNKIDLSSLKVKTNLYGIWGTGNVIYAVGASGTILKYDGTNWSQETSPVSSDLYCVGGTDENIYIFGDIESLSKIAYLKYNSGYSRWDLISTNISSIKDNKRRVPIYSMKVAGGNVYAVGRAGTVLKYDGTNWNDISPNLKEVIYGICVDNGGKIYISGGSGLTGIYDGNWIIDNKWETWKNYTGQIQLPEGITSIEYFAIDRVGNEENHHKIIDPGKGIVKQTYDGKGKGNLRNDDNVPDPDVEITPSLPDGNNGWYTSPVKIKFTYKNENNWLDPLPTGELGSGINKFQFALLNSPGTPANFIDYVADRQALQEIQLTEGTHYIYYRAIDNLGNKSYVMIGGEIRDYLTYSGNPIKIDLNKPITSIAPTSDGKFKLTASDTMSGVDKIYYKTGTEPTNEKDGTEYIEPFTIPTGTTKIYYWSIDYAGNSDFYNVYNVEVEDTTPPTISLNLVSGNVYPDITALKIYVTSEENTNILNRTRLGLQASDNSGGTGIKDIRYKFNNSPTDPYTDGYSYLETGDFYIPKDTTKIYYWAIDGANNYKVESKDIVVDDDAPKLTINLTPGNPDNTTDWYNVKTGIPSMTIISDETNPDATHSGLKEIKYDLNGGTPGTLYNSPVVLYDGTYQIVVSGEDNLGNKSQIQYPQNPVKVDTTIPTMSLVRNGRNVTLTINDTGSGPGYIYYFTTNDDTYVPNESDYVERRIFVSNSITISLPEGDNKIWYKGKDKAGNETSSDYKIFVAEMEPPVSSITIKGSPIIDRVKTGNNVIIEGTWSDESGPVRVVSLRLLDQDGNLIMDLPTNIITITGTTTGNYSGNFVLPSLSQNITRIKLELTVMDSVESDKGIVEDYLCNRETVESNLLVVDNENPKINIKAILTGRTPQKVNNIWWYKNVIPIEIEISDDAGLDTAVYSLDGGSSWYEVKDESDELGKKVFNLENSMTKIKVRAKDKLGNETEVEGINEFVDGQDYYGGLIYVDTYAPKVKIVITKGGLWPGIPPANIDTDNPELPVPEEFTPPINYPQRWVDYIFITSNTTFKLIADDTPPSTETSDGKASSGFNILASIPNYRISTSSEVLDSDDKWGVWLNPTINYYDKDGDGYYEYSETKSEFSLPENVTSIWYYAEDNLGNKEEHKIVETQDRHPVNSRQEIGSGNIRVDDSVPGPDLEITPSSPDGNNGWYKSAVSIEIKYNDANNYNDPLPTGEIGSGFNKFQYVIKTGSTTPSDSEYTDYTPGYKINISAEGSYYLFYRAVDNIGNKSLKTTSIKVDGTKPTVDLTLLNNGTFYLTALDYGSQVEKVYYKFILSDGTENLYSQSGSSTTFTAPSGINRIEYWAIDYAGNESDHLIKYISDIDKTPPTTTINYSTPYYLAGNTLYVTSEKNTASTLGKTVFTITSTDPLVNNFASGIAIGYPEYRIENSLPDWTVYSGQFYVKSNDTKIEAYAKDGAGNTGNTAILNIVVDDDAPEIKNVTLDRNPDSTTGWYNSSTGKPKIVIDTEDKGSGVYQVKYSYDGQNYSLYTGPFDVYEGKELSLTLYVNAADNLRNTITSISSLPTINVDITSPGSTIIPLPGRKFKISSSDNVSGIKKIFYQFDNNEQVEINFASGNLTEATEEIDIPFETKQIKYWAVDFAGNTETYKTYNITQITISGYVRDYSGNPVSNVKVILSGEANRVVFTDNSGFYIFTDLSSIGMYCITPAIQNGLPSFRFYDGTATSNLTNQNFIIPNGWRFKEYDMANTNDYYFKSNTVLPSYSTLTVDWYTGPGGDILTGDIDFDGNPELIIKGQYQGVMYSYNKNIGYFKKGEIATAYNLGLLDSIDLDFQLETILTKSGQDLLELYDKNWTKIGSKSFSGPPLPPDNTLWGVRFAGNYMLLAGNGTNSDGSVYTNIMLYDYSKSTPKWTKLISQKIDVDKTNICIRDDKIMLVFGGISDTSDLNVYAIDVFTGSILWTKSLTNQKGRIITLVSPGVSNEIIGIRMSTSQNQVPLTIYKFDPLTGNILMQSSFGIYTQDIKYALSDIDNDNVKELLISDSYGNLYVIDMSQFILKKVGTGNVWACVDFDGKPGKEIIVSSGTYVKVLDYNLNEIMSYNLQENIRKVIVSDINNDGIIEIIASTSTKTYILRPTTQNDLPNAPTNLRCELGVNSIYIYWNYVPSTGSLRGFKIYRSTNTSNWGEPVKIIYDPNARTATDTPPSTGIWYYKVSAFNDFGEVDCVNPGSYLIEYRETIPEEVGGGCFIASVCFGENSWQVRILKEFRDKILMKISIGKKFVRFYYTYAPYVKEYIKDRVLIKHLVKISLYPVVFIAYLLINYFILAGLFFLICFYFIRKFKINQK